MQLINKMSLKNLLLPVLSIALIFMFTNIKADSSVELKGSIQVKSDSSITVNNVEILVTASTKFEGEEHSNLTFDSLRVGDFVEVEAEINFNGKLVASSIHLINSHVITYIEIEGKITSITSNSIFVNETEVFVDLNTVISTQFHSAIKFTDLKVNDNVKVKAIQKNDGTYLAISIKVETENSRREVEVEGKIEALSDSSLTVNGTVFLVTNGTIIMSEKHGIIAFSNLIIGENVSVRGFLKEDSTYTAILIKVEDEKLTTTELELHGKVTAVDSNSLTVNNILCFVDSSTVIFTHNGNLLNLSDIKIGVVVEVKAVLQNDGTYKAQRIKLLNEMEDDKEIEIEGVINATTVNSITIGGYEIFINDSTRIYSETGLKLSITDLIVGTNVKVHAYLQMGVYYASKIKVKEHNKTEIKITGAVDKIEGNTITVKGVTFITDEKTEFLSSDRTRITLNDLKAGQIVSIRAIIQNDGAKYAFQVKIDSYWHSAVIVEGPIDSLSANSISVAGRTFFVDSLTVVLASESGKIDFSNLVIGQKVEIKGTFDSNGILKARLIKVHENNEYEVYGTIDSVGTSFIVVANLTINVNQNTVYYNEFDNLVTFDSLMVGQVVEVNYMKINTNENLATKIEIEKQPNSFEFSGVVVSHSTNKIDFSALSLSYNSSTVFINSLYQPISSSEINMGQSLYVWAAETQNGTIQALQVQVLGEVTSVNQGVGNQIPTTFELFQNYPNPFNPSTIISFRLSVGSFVTLKVYDILGREISTLINEYKPAGEYKVRFNAASLPTGVYLYKLNAGTQTSVRKMLLLK
ncbi:DUF5666 domain-containing protein [Melioribacteraceae bacterium 4301-Me]|uniref:DUF5666 domain-containing protein n=1 Tax=Pyranulibacter aquaticus TaxID=3163344 RepID=UPI003594C6A7